MKNQQNNISYHHAVLLEKSVEELITDKDGNYVDATYGGGGHSREILNSLNNGKLFCFDQDDDASANLLEDPRLTYIPANYCYIKNFLRYYDALPVAGILADLGISSHQINTASRGFSTRYDYELDMRMDQNNPKKAENVIMEYPEEELIKIFKTYGELHNAKKLAQAIVSERNAGTIDTTHKLASIAKKFTSKNNIHKYLAQVFQAVRIEVNQEMENLKLFLEKSLEVLDTGGRLVVISYHSLEDRLVKNFIKSGNFEGNIKKDFYGNVIAPLKAMNRKPVVPDPEETEKNPRSRSAKMRIAEKL